MSDKLPEWPAPLDIDAPQSDWVTHVFKTRDAAVSRMYALRDALRMLLVELAKQPNVLISEETLMQCSEAIAACERRHR